ETFAPVVAEIARAQGATLISATATSVGKDLAPRVAGLLDAGMASDISKLAGKDTFVRPVLAGNAYSTVQVSTPIIVVTPRQSEFEPAAELGSPGAVTTTAPGNLDALGAEFVRLDAQKIGRAHV